MDLNWLWLIVPGVYILVSLFLTCFPIRAKHRFRNPLLNTLADGQRILCIGHRGGSFEGPENTLQLFRSSASVSHMFQLDVCQTLDHQLVVHHDANLKRTTGRNLDIKDVPATQLPQMQSQIQAFGGKIIQTQSNTLPLLDALFTQFPHILMNIDLKTPTQTSIQEFARLIRKHQREDITVWGSAKDQPCNQLSGTHPQVITFYSSWQVFKVFMLCISGLLPFWNLRPGVLDIPLLTDSLVNIAYNFAQSPCTKVLLCLALMFLRFFNLMSRLFIPHLRKRGILTFYWILNEKEDWERAISMGCRGIMTDVPTQLSEYLKEKELYFEGSSDSF